MHTHHHCNPKTPPLPIPTPASTPTETPTEYFLPAPPETEIITADGERDDMDDYVQDFGAHKHGYNIRKGNSATGLICHYHCHRGGYPPKKEGQSQPSRSLRIGCNFKLTARVNHAKKSWLLIHVHLGHNHPPDFTIKPRKRKPRQPKPNSTKPIPQLQTPLSNLEPINTTTHDPNPIYAPQSTTQIHNDTSTLPTIIARLEAMSPNRRQQKLQQIDSILNKEASQTGPKSYTERHEHNPNEYHRAHEMSSMAEDHLMPEELSVSPSTARRSITTSI